MQKLLVVDDDSNITKVINYIASQLGYQVTEVNDPLAAMAMFHAVMPDVLVLDLMMPGRDGLDILKDILASGTMPHIILLSSLHSGYVRVATALARSHGYRNVQVLEKPFSRAEFEKLLPHHGGTP